MYCIKCGKFIEGESTLCPECQKAEQEAQMQAAQAAAQAQAAQPEAQRNGMMDGFGKALTGAILGVVSCAFSIMSYIMSIVVVASSPAPADVTALSVTFTLFAIASTVLGIIFGISSIQLFAKKRSQDAKKPIPTLVLGIVSVATAAFSILWLLFTFMICAIILVAMY